MIGTENLVSMPEATRQTGLSSQTLRIWARTGKVRAQNLGGRLWVFDRADLERATAERQQRIATGAA